MTEAIEVLQRIAAVVVSVAAVQRNTAARHAFHLSPLVALFLQPQHLHVEVKMTHYIKSSSAHDVIEEANDIATIVV